MIIIGEKINASIPGVKPVIDDRDGEKLVALARVQAEAGAAYIDVNVGTGKGSGADEADAMAWAVRTLQAGIDKPLCIDSADPAVLEAGLAAREGKPALINSAKAEADHLEAVVPLAARFKVPFVGLAMDETGIPKTADGRLAACAKIVAACEKHGVPLKDVYFDALVLPVITDDKQGLITLDTIRTVKATYPEARTAVGLSNISYGLPARKMLNAAFLHMAACAGLDAVLMDPLSETMMNAVRAAAALTGKDRHFRKFTRAFRNKTTT